MEKVNFKKVLVLFVSLLFICVNLPIYSQANFPDQALLKRAQSGDAQAQVEVGKIYLSGAKGLPADYFTAYDWFHKAELKNYAEAFYQIGRMHHYGQIGPLEIYSGMFDNSDYSGFQAGHPGANIDYSKALAWYMKAANLNHVGAQYGIATIHAMEWQNGRRGRPNAGEAMNWYRKAADNGNGYAILELYDIYKDGWRSDGLTLVRADKNEAAKWYDRAANHEDPEIPFLLGLRSFRILNKKLEEEVVRLFRKAVDQNYALAMYNMGRAYEGGWGVKQNQIEAAKWYRSAAENGDAEIQFMVGEKFEEGVGGRKGRDIDEAVKWYCSAGENGNARMAYRVGMKFYEGTVGIESVAAMEARISKNVYIKRSNAEAFKWFYKAASEGISMVTPLNHYPYDNLWFINANQVVRTMFIEGKVVQKDDKEAAKWGFIISFPPDLKNNDRNAFMISEFLRHAKEIAEEWNARWGKINPQMTVDANTNKTSTASAVQPAPAPASAANSDFEIKGTTLVKYNGKDENVTIPASVTVIGYKAFEGKKITGVTIPAGVTTIEEFAFTKNKLTSVIIPNSVTTIKDFTFDENQITSVTIGSGVTSIGSYAFHDNKLTSVTIPNSVISIGDNAFGKNQITSVTIGSRVTVIGEGAFDDNKLKSVIIPNTVITIGRDAFSSNQLTSVTIPNSVTSIGTSAFWSNQLTSVTIGSNVTSIGVNAFMGNQLTAVTIPNSVTSIGDNAFAYNKLTSITIGANVNIGKDGFDNEFDKFYQNNKRMADTYTYNGMNWSAKTAPASVATPVQPTPTPTPTVAPVQTTPAPANVNPNFIPPSVWSPSDGESPGVTKKSSVGREVIEGQQKDVITMEVTFPSQTQAGGTGKWGAFKIGEYEPALLQIRNATGVRFKAIGDGKRWIIQFHTKETMVDWGSYEAEIKTVPNRVVEINIPYGSLAQPSWANKVPFVRNNITSVNIQRMTNTASEIGPSTLKVFDFEVYSGTAPAPAMPTTQPSAAANANLKFIPPSAWVAGDGDFPGTTKRISSTREVIGGQGKDILTLEVTFPKQNGSKWATYSVNGDNESVMSQLRAGSGIRFKALGDGKRWIIQIQTTDTSSDWCGFEAEIKTTNNKVVEINIPYSSLKQATWGKKASWVKSNIIGINIQRNSQDTGASTLKVFDFEVY